MYEMYRTVSSAIIDLLAIVGRTRFSFLVVLIGAGVLALNAQGLEAIRTVAAAPWGNRLLFLTAALGWALSAWYFARILCDRTFQREETSDTKEWFRWVTDHLPRFLGFLAFLAVAAAFWTATAHTLSIISLVLGVLFYAFAVLRRYFLGGSRGRKRTDALTLRQLPKAQKIVFFVMLLLALIAMAIATAWTVEIGRWLGAGTILLLGFALIVPVGTLMILRSLASGFPVITALLVLALLFSRFNDNHALRLVEAPDGEVESIEVASATAESPAGYETRNGTVVTVRRPTLNDLYDDWYFSNCRGTGREEPSSPAPCPLVLVATAGGGSRAAYWTTTVLGTLTDIGNRLAEAEALQQPFDSSLFAVSGVSGGALGAVFYRSLLTHAERAGNLRAISGSAQDETEMPCGSFKDCGQALAGGDFLAPVLTGFLFPDLLQRFLPLPLFDDRAAALEKGWETQWASVMGNGSLDLGEGMLSLWSVEQENGLGPQYRFWPALYLNGTHVETSRRIITSNVDLGNSLVAPVFGRKELVHADAFDLFDTSIHPCDIPLSTAANNSARFPYVDPAGRIRTGCTGENWGHVVDGGYFENFGAQTALEILDALVTYSVKGASQDDTGRRFSPIVIQISSDPGFAGEFTDQRHDQAAAEAMGRFTNWANEAMSPVRAFMGLRGAQGRRAFAGLERGTFAATERLIEDQSKLAEYRQHLGGERRPRARALARGIPLLHSAGFAHFRMCPGGKKREEPALGWALSKEAQATIENYLPADAVAEAGDPTKLETFCKRDLSEQSRRDSYDCRKSNAAALQTVVCGLAGLRNRP